MIKWLSLYDIMNSPEGAALVRDGTEEQFLEFMHAIGFDTNKPIERQECYHRPFTRKTNDPVFGMRFVGTERNDDAWRKSGMWSLDARLEEYRATDFDLYQEMYRMNYHFNHTGALIGHMLSKGSQLPYYNQISGEDLENNED
jgi:hypothetical protein